MKALVLGLIVASVLSGCAVPVKEIVVEVPAATPATCEPKTAPKGWRYWGVTNTRPFMSEAGPIHLVRLENQGKSVNAGWLNGFLVIFDLNPDDEAPVLVLDAAMMTDKEGNDTPLKTPVSKACVWRPMRSAKSST